MKVIFLYTGSVGFPLGDAYTNRILSLAKGLIQNGIDVRILLLYPGRKSGVKEKKGIYESIPYEYLTAKESYNGRFAKKLMGVIGISRCIIKLLTEHADAKAVISFTESPIQNGPICRVSKWKGILFIREVNEFPRPVLKAGTVDISREEEDKIAGDQKNFDGLICISHGLRDYFKDRCKFTKPILIVPITVDKDRFNSKGNFKGKTISYCGNLFGEKDGVHILIEAFAKVSKKYSDWNLKLIGDNSDEIEFGKMKKRIEELGINNKVVFTGQVQREEIPILLAESSVLVLARPDNIQAQGGFPTKLGEYLATGNPTVVTSVGDIPLFIKNGVNGFLAKPGSIENFSDHLDYVLSHPSEAEKVGEQGRRLIDDVFDANVQAASIKSFIMDLGKN